MMFPSASLPALPFFGIKKSTLFKPKTTPPEDIFGAALC